MTPTPNHALQRTPGFGVQLPRAALIRPAQSRAVLPAMKPGTARAFASRRCAHSRAAGPESLSLGSLGHMDELQQLQEWCISQCNQDWEHTYGVKTDARKTRPNPLQSQHKAHQ